MRVADDAFVVGFCRRHDTCADDVQRRRWAR
jgi:hypothetical protein